ncbi:MAG: hypothetical protein C5B47_04020 [Verrucomicrobia bacterium]|nr:MAG: hypothetical protein C5B47_04020 [Verrucomicrobiota bacterium]
MNRYPSLHFALIVSCIFLILGYILARLHSEEPVQIQVLPLKSFTGDEMPPIQPTEGEKADFPLSGTPSAATSIR